MSRRSKGYAPKPPTSTGIAGRHTLSQVGNVWLCACGLGIFGAETKQDATCRHQFHLRAVREHLDAEMEQRQVEAQLYDSGDYDSKGITKKYDS